MLFDCIVGLSSVFALMPLMCFSKWHGLLFCLIQDHFNYRLYPFDRQTILITFEVQGTNLFSCNGTQGLAQMSLESMSHMQAQEALLPKTKTWWLEGKALGSEWGRRQLVLTSTGTVSGGHKEHLPFVPAEFSVHLPAENAHSIHTSARSAVWAPGRHV